MDHSLPSLIYGVPLIQVFFLESLHTITWNVPELVGCVGLLSAALYPHPPIFPVLAVSLI